MSLFWQRAFIVFWKDVAIERRSKETLNALAFFSLLLLFLFQFSLGADRERLTAALPGLLWLGFVLSGLLALGRSFMVERENDCWEGLLLAPGDKSAIFLGKLAGNLLLMFIVEALLLALFAVFFNVDVGRALGPLPPIADLSAAPLLEAMQHDKKVSHGKVVGVWPNAIGRGRIAPIERATFAGWVSTVPVGARGRSR